MLKAYDYALRLSVCPHALDRDSIVHRSLAQVHAVQDAAPARRGVLLLERAQRREATRAEVAGRLRAALPELPEPLRVLSTRTPRAMPDVARLARYRNCEGVEDTTQKCVVRSLAADIGRMLL